MKAKIRFEKLTALVEITQPNKFDSIGLIEPKTKKLNKLDESKRQIIEKRLMNSIRYGKDGHIFDKKDWTPIDMYHAFVNNSTIKLLNVKDVPKWELPPKGAIT